MLFLLPLNPGLGTSRRRERLRSVRGIPRPTRPAGGAVAPPSTSRRRSARRAATPPPRCVAVSADLVVFPPSPLFCWIVWAVVMCCLDGGGAEVRMLVLFFEAASRGVGEAKSAPPVAFCCSLARRVHAMQHSAVLCCLCAVLPFSQLSVT